MSSEYRTTGASSTECAACEGFGLTPRNRTKVIQTEQNGQRVWKTVQQGSGCLICLGTGQLETAEKAKLVRTMLFAARINHGRAH